MAETGFKSLDGLRALFLLWVLFVHAPSTAIPQFLAEPHSHWVLGVDGFLAISGFLVTRSLEQCVNHALMEGRSKSSAIRAFLLRRIARIVPPYYFILGCILILALATRNGLYKNIITAWKSVLGFPFFYANYSIPMDSERIPSLLQPFWSISYQEQFYIVLSLAFLGLGFSRLFKIFLLAGGLISVVLRILSITWLWRGQLRGWEYEANLHLAFDSMSWGCLAWIFYKELSFLWKDPIRSRVTNCLIIILLGLAIGLRSVWFSQDSMGILSIFRAPMLALFVLMIAQSSDGLLVTMLQLKPLRELGKISYEVYLISPILYSVLARYSSSLGLAFLPIAIACALPMGWIFNRNFGRPIQMALRNHWDSKQPIHRSDAKHLPVQNLA